MTEPGEALARTYVYRAVRSDRLGHAYLLWGPDSDERDRRAREIAKSLVCEEGPQEDRGPCGRCRPCHEVAVGTYAGFLDMTGEKAHIEIEDIRSLGQKLAIAFEKRRSVFIPKLERLTPPAAHAFLKILEEPGGLTVYLLTTGRPSTIIPTILSRCHQLPFFVATESTVQTDLSEVEPLLGNPNALADMDLGDLIKPLPGQNKRERLQVLLTHLLRQVEVRVQELAGHGTGAPTLFAGVDHDDMLDWADTLLAFAEDVTWNVNVDLILEGLAFRLRRIPRS